MNIKSTLFGICSLSLFSLGVTIVIIFNINPYEADLFTFIALFSSIFLSLTGVVTITEYSIRSKYYNHTISTALSNSIRHGLTISLGVIILSTLQLLRLLNIFDAILIICIILSSELYFKSRAHA